MVRVRPRCARTRPGSAKGLAVGGAIRAPSGGWGRAADQTVQHLARSPVVRGVVGGQKLDQASVVGSQLPHRVSQPLTKLLTPDVAQSNLRGVVGGGPLIELGVWHGFHDLALLAPSRVRSALRCSLLVIPSERSTTDTYLERGAIDRCGPPTLRRRSSPFGPTKALGSTANSPRGRSTDGPAGQPRRARPVGHSGGRRQPRSRAGVHTRTRRHSPPCRHRRPPPPWCAWSAWWTWRWHWACSSGGRPGHGC